MKGRVDHVAAVMAKATQEERRRALAWVPYHLQAEVKALVEKPWSQREAMRRRRRQRRVRV